MTRVTVTLCPRGRGRWSPVVLTYDPKRRHELPAPMEFKRGQIVSLAGREYRVAGVSG